jgi:hypothetical protein
MQTYTSSALMGILISLSAISCLKFTAQFAHWQSANQSIQASATQVTHQLSHRGSGRAPACETWS